MAIERQGLEEVKMLKMGLALGQRTDVKVGTKFAIIRREYESVVSQWFDNQKSQICLKLFLTFRTV
jgi:hypothetical protein